MQRALEDILVGLKSAKSHDDLQKAVSDMRDRYEVNQVVYHAVGRNGDHFAALTYDPDWVARYIEQNYARIDPVVQGCYQRFNPVDWNELDWSAPKARKFRAEAAEAGVGTQGLSLPLRGPNGHFALFTVSANVSERDWAQYKENLVNDLILVAHFVNQKALEMQHDGPEAPPLACLSPREVDTLSLLALGYSRAQAAEALSISEHTLRVYIESARFKLGGSNTTHAVAKAISAGLIFR